MYLHYRSMGNLFGVANSTVLNCAVRFCRALVRLNSVHGFIKWPTRDTAAAVVKEFEDAYGFPGLNCTVGLLYKK